MRSAAPERTGISSTRSGLSESNVRVRIAANAASAHATLKQINFVIRQTAAAPLSV
jgi:hypothetical protein